VIRAVSKQAPPAMSSDRQVTRELTVAQGREKWMRVCVPALVALTACGHSQGVASTTTTTPKTSAGSSHHAGKAVIPRVTADCQHFRRKPTRIIIACGDGGFYLEGIRYDRWSSDSASGTATAVSRRCVPDCQSGSSDSSAVRITLDRIRTVFGARVFTRVTLRQLNAKRTRHYFLLPLGCSITPPHCPKKRPF
jgi:hypothetical protein